MTQRKKNNIIIGSLCVVVLLMAVGYAAFSSILNIKGTSSISSNWNILITNVDEKNIVGSATNAEEPSWEDLTATFKTNLVSPGDSIEYDITIENRGNLNAKLDKITLTDSNNPAIKFTSSGLEEGTELNAGGIATLTVKVEYDNNVISQPESTEGTFTVTLDYSQKEGSGDVNNTIDMKGVEVIITTNGDGLYEDEYEPGRYVYKGTNPDNYITFNNELWRIISVEADGAVKIFKERSIRNSAFDTKGYRDSGSNGAGGTYCAQSSNNGCNAWVRSNNFVNGYSKGTVLKDATLNTYLNQTYYSTLSTDTRAIISSYNWKIGPVEKSNLDLAAQIQSENSIIWNGNVGLISVSDFIRANSNSNQCGTLNANENQYGICLPTNYIKPTGSCMLMFQPRESSYYSIFVLDTVGAVTVSPAFGTGCGIHPVTHLKSDITLSGSGTSDDPYRVVS